MLRSIFLAAVALSSVACGPVESTNNPSGGGGGACEPFTPLASDFAGYHGWKSFHLEHGSQPDGVHDVNAPLTAYINELPPKGATSFPIGTIIVKEVEQGPITQRKVFSMAKHGCGYNADGAVDWEWFELNRNEGSDDTARIVWGSIEPPKGDTYSGTTKGACNGCHEGAKSNDYVWSSPLFLKSLENEK